MDINFKDLTIKKEDGKIIVSASFNSPKKNSSEQNLGLRYANHQEIKNLLKQNNIAHGELLKNDTLDTRYPKTMSAEWIFAAPPIAKKAKRSRISKPVTDIGKVPVKAPVKASTPMSASIKKKTTKKEV